MILSALCLRHQMAYHTYHGHVHVSRIIKLWISNVTARKASRSLGLQLALKFPPSLCLEPRYRTEQSHALVSKLAILSFSSPQTSLPIPCRLPPRAVKTTVYAMPRQLSLPRDHMLPDSSLTAVRTASNLSLRSLQIPELGRWSHACPIAHLTVYVYTHTQVLSYLHCISPLPSPPVRTFTFPSGS